MSKLSNIIKQTFYRDLESLIDCDWSDISWVMFWRGCIVNGMELMASGVYFKQEYLDKISLFYVKVSECISDNNIFNRQKLIDELADIKKESR